MKIAIISDTHDNVHNILKIASILKKRKISLVIHCGDVVAPATVKYFSGLNMKFVFGNCDGDKLLLRRRIMEINAECLDDLGEIGVEGKKIGIYHGTNQARLKGMINSKKYDYIFTGHTHKAMNKLVGKTRIINPGAHYYGTENTIAILDTNNDSVEFLEAR